MYASDSSIPRLSEGVLAAVTDTALFYPHSGVDFISPVKLFAPWVTDFWFADLAYFGSSDPADSSKPVLPNGANYMLESVEVEGPPVAVMEHINIEGSNERKTYRSLLPCVRTEQYRHVETGRTFRIHRRRGFSTCAFHKLGSFGVFFYRRDSSEGSSVPWLSAPNWSSTKRQRWLVHEVVDKLIQGGLIVTDGSRCEGEFNPYRGFTQFFCNSIIGAKAAERAKPFSDDEGRQFKCVGYAGEGNGPVLIWQVNKATTGKTRQPD